MVLTGATKERIDLQSKLKANGDAVHSQESLEAFRSEPVHGQTERVTVSEEASDGGRLEQALPFTDAGAEAAKATDMGGVINTCYVHSCWYFSLQCYHPF